MPNETSRTKIERLVKLLSDNSENGSLHWDVTSDEDAFRLASGVANVRIEKSNVFDDVFEQFFPRRILLIFNNQGRLVEEYVPSESVEVKAFDQLFDVARRSAFHTDDILDQLLKEVQGGRE